MAIQYPPGLADRIARVLSDILTDKYGEEYGVKITLHWVDKETGERMDGIDRADVWRAASLCVITANTPSLRISGTSSTVT